MINGKTYRTELKLLVKFIVDMVNQAKASFNQPFELEVNEELLLVFPPLQTAKQTVSDVLLQELDVKLWDKEIRWLWDIVNCLPYIR